MQQEVASWYEIAVGVGVDKLVPARASTTASSVSRTTAAAISGPANRGVHHSFSEHRFAAKPLDSMLIEIMVL